MELTKEKLQEMYYSMSNTELANKLGISLVTLSKLVKDNAIEPKGKGNWYNRKPIRII